jgi:hypothetical protein
LMMMLMLMWWLMNCKFYNKMLPHFCRPFLCLPVPFHFVHFPRPFGISALVRPAFTIFSQIRVADLMEIHIEFGGSKTKTPRSERKELFYSGQRKRWEP